MAHSLPFQLHQYHVGATLHHYVHRLFYISETTQECDPRQEWRQLQEEMLRQYLATAECDLRAKQELADIKNQRLNIAQDEYHHLNSTLSNLSASTTSRKWLRNVSYN